MTVTVPVSHKGKTHTVQVDLTSTVSSFQAQLKELTSVPIENQKLLFKGKNASAKSDDTLEIFGLTDRIKVQMLGSTAEEVGGLRAVEDERKQTEQTLRNREAQARTYSPSTRSRATTSNLSYRFHDIQSLAHLPNSGSARSFLTRLANDEAILHVMNLHKFSVGLLTELAPHEHPGLLGLNTNQGQSIKLRIRTDQYDGFRNFKDIRRVLCHELAHNVWGDHDNDFKELNSLLNREVAEYEFSLDRGTHKLVEGDFYDPELSGAGYALGGSPGASLPEFAREERRQRMLAAALNRLRTEEEEMEQSCGTTGPAKAAPVGTPTDTQ
ncbi:WLM domain-containing protein [Thelephora terrestris]|uniref:WLM domain-containing protein n=1 Tax=Thelephora terrestris TaxID=56493 RepID=A0A9P6HDM7_9AGAM|nr:WLM domain-containing protein [Thelephora terrestris]